MWARSEMPNFYPFAALRNDCLSTDSKKSRGVHSWVQQTTTPKTRLTRLESHRALWDWYETWILIAAQSLTHWWMGIRRFTIVPSKYTKTRGFTMTLSRMTTSLREHQYPKIWKLVNSKTYSPRCHTLSGRRIIEGQSKVPQTCSEQIALRSI